MSDSSLLDVLIIGSGPAGLSAAIYALRANLKVQVAEKEYHGTGQIAESGSVDNYLGLPGMNGYDMGEAFREHALKLGTLFYEGMADGFEFKDNVWEVHFADGQVLRTKTVIYCAGAMHRHLNVEGEEEFIGKGVSYCAVCDGAFYRGKDTAVIGGGDTALGDALYLSDLCDKVYLVHRREEFRGSPLTVQQLREKDNVEIITNAAPAKIIGEQAVTALELKDGQTLPVHGTFVAIGMEPQTEHLDGIVALDDNGYVIADETGRTSAPGFFAAGDVRTKALRQVVTAVSDGANAAVCAAEYIKNLTHRNFDLSKRLLQEKKEKLIQILKELDSVAVAFSGGVDSAFLLKMAQEVLGDRAEAVTVQSCVFPERELKEAKEFCKQYGIRHEVCHIHVLEIEGFRNNPENRCYLCKYAILQKMMEVAKNKKLAYVIEGSNVDDDGDYRPGHQAITELGIRSPLREAGLTKADIRELSKQMGLPTWEKQSFACLASRFVYGEPITEDKLSMVDRAEQQLLDLGFRQVRVRIHGKTARIEVLPEEFSRLVQPKIREQIIDCFMSYGFSYVTMDLKGYRTGSMNEEI